jgi:hypothetical protein
MIHFLLYANKAEEKGVDQLGFMQELRRNSSKSDKTWSRLSSNFLLSSALAEYRRTMVSPWRRACGTSIIQEPLPESEGSARSLEDEYCQYKSSILLCELALQGLEALVGLPLKDGVDVDAQSQRY